MNVDKIRMTLLHKREQKGLSAEALGKMVGVNKTTIYRYEKGQIEKMPFTVINRLAEVLGINPAFIAGFSDEPDIGVSTTLTKITDTSAKLKESGQKKVLKCAEDELKEQEKEIEKASSTKHDEIKQTTDNIIHIPKTKADEKFIPVKYYGAVSAGTGEFLFGVEIADTVYLPEIKVPTTPFDYALRINGDSMEPTFKHRQYIFVQSFSEGGDIRNGMLAIVLYESQVYFKKLCIEHECVRLVSLNKKYPDIHVPNPDGFKVLGKVVWEE